MAFQKAVYFNQATNRLTDSSYANISPDAYPVLGYQANERWAITIHDGASAVDLSDAVTWSAAIDKDFMSALINGALTDGFSGAVTAITADGFASAPPSAGVLWLTNGAGQYESVAYSSWTVNAGIYTFAVSATLAYTYLNDDICQVENTAPMCRTLNANIDSSLASTGVIKPLWDANTSTFLAAVNGSESIPAYCEIKGFDSYGKRIYWFIFRITAKMMVDPSQGTPPGPASAYWTKDEADARFVGKIDGTQITLANGTTNIIIGAVASIRSAVVDVAVISGSDCEHNTIRLIHNGSSVGVGRQTAKVGSDITGLTWSADISSGNMRLICANSGSAVTAVYKISAITINT